MQVLNPTVTTPCLKSTQHQHTVTMWRMLSKRRLLISSVVLVLVTCFFGQTHAQSWVATNTSPFSTDWLQGLNWSPQSVPTSTTDVSITQTGTNRVFPRIASGSAFARDITLQNASNSLTIGTGGSLVARNLVIGNPSLLGTGSGLFFISSGATASFADVTAGFSQVTIESGAQVSAKSVLMFSQPSHFAVRGAGSKLTIGQAGSVTALEMGTFSQGLQILTISNGAVTEVLGDGVVALEGLANLATFAVADPSNTVSAIIKIGEGGSSGALLADSVLGRANFQSGASFGTGAFSVPRVDFDHTNTHIFTPNLRGNIIINKRGSGTTILQANNNLGTVFSTINAPSHRDVVIIEGFLQVGNNGTTGRLALNNAKVQVLATGELISWRADDTVWQYVMDGGGGLRKRGAGGLTLATSSSGVSTFTGGVHLDEGALTLAGNSVAGTGVIRAQANTTLAFTDGVSIANNVSLLGAPVDLRINTGAATLTGTLAEIGGSRSLRKVGAGTLTLAGGNSFTGGATIDAGVLRADHQTALGGNLLTNNATLELSLAATAATSLNVFNYSQSSSALLRTSVTGTGCVAKRLAATDFAQLGGTLEVSFGSGCVPTNGQIFTIVTAGNNVSGTFASVNITGVPSVVSFMASYTATSVILTASAPAVCTVGNFSATGYAPCTPAAAGNFVAISGAMAQTACAVGSYQPASGQSACILASAGNFVGATGAIAQSACTPGNYQANTGQASCVAASAGSFVSSSAAIAQTPCVAGSFSPSSGALSCTLSGTGFYVATAGATTQTACLAGSFNPNIGSTSMSACIAAPAGSFVSLIGQAASTPCAAGSFQPNTGQSSCILASTGSFVGASGATTQSVCPLGSYQPNSGQSSCFAASAGHFVGTTGATAQTACTPGNYQPNTGQSSCIAASAGSFVGGSGALLQTPCVAGSFSAASGASVCTLAAINFFVPNAGATAQTACPANTFSAITGATVCISSIQTITFNTISVVNQNATPIVLAATGGASGNPVTFTSLTPNICTTGGVNGSTLSFILNASGTCTVRAAQAGDTNYQAAANVERSIGVAAPPPPPQPPSAPSGLVCTGANTTANAATINCTFNSATVTGNNTLTGYTLYCRDASGSVTYNQSLASDATSFTLPSTLPRDRSLTCYLSASGNGGTSPTISLLIAPQSTPLANRQLLDIDGNGFSVIVLRGSGNTESSQKLSGTKTLIGRFDGVKFNFTEIPDAGTDWDVLGAGDFIGSGRTALLARNAAEQVRINLNLSTTDGTLLRTAKRDWEVDAIGDLDGDGRADILWRYMKPGSNDSGVTFAWFMDGNAANNTVSVNEVKHRGGAPLNWNLIGMVDLDGDRRSDIIWQSPTGQLRTLLGQAKRGFINQPIAQLPVGYTITKLGDFDGDGRGDIMLANPQGQLKLWTLEIATASTTQRINIHNDLAITPPPTGWKFYAAGDFDGNGTMDIVWIKPDNSLALWLFGRLSEGNHGKFTLVNNVGVAPLGFRSLEP
jgi:trimeric autotransporter adhesin